jgi:uncharacterized protein (DUF305 family)
MKKMLLLALLTVPSVGFSVENSSLEQKPVPSAHDEMHAAMTNMCEGMDQMAMTGKIDHDFLTMMMPHHQAAIDMAKAYLKEGAAPEIRAMAEEIIKAQEKEILDMQIWLKEHPVNNVGHHRK